MDNQSHQKIFDLSDQVVVVTGGAGVLCATLCRALVAVGAKIAILDINFEAAELLANDINQHQGNAMAFTCDVTKKESIQEAAQRITSIFGGLDILINGAGGNSPRATTRSDLSFFDLPESAIDWVIELNLIGTIMCSQVFGKVMAEQKKGIILNISSMNAFRPLTRIPAYSGAKAAISNFTQWLAVHMAQEYSPAIRVNAIAPGFFMTDQNRFLLMDQATGGLTQRGKSIIDHTPMGRFGNPDDIVGTVLWLLSPASAFITGVIVPIDGGFSAYSGV